MYKFENLSQRESEILWRALYDSETQERERIARCVKSLEGQEDVGRGKMYVNIKKGAEKRLKEIKALQMKVIF
jgi:hypothetical protein